MSPIAGKTARPIGLKFLIDTQGFPGGQARSQGGCMRTGAPPFLLKGGCNDEFASPPSTLATPMVKSFPRAWFFLAYKVFNSDYFLCLKLKIIDYVNEDDRYLIHSWSDHSYRATTNVKIKLSKFKTWISHRFFSIQSTDGNQSRHSKS